jgi:hypothetical protein
MHDNLSSKIAVLFPLLMKPEGSFLCSKESVILSHSDPHEPNSQPRFGKHALTNNTLCYQQVLYGIAEPSTVQDPIEGTQNYIVQNSSHAFDITICEKWIFSKTTRKRGTKSFKGEL